MNNLESEIKKKDLFLSQLQTFLKKEAAYSKRLNEVASCSDFFNNEDGYEKERRLLQENKQSNLSSNRRGEILEEIVFSLFNRVEILEVLNRNKAQTLIGQIDLQALVIHESAYDILGLRPRPKSDLIIGECKNLRNKSVELENIEKACWRSCKSTSLQFFIGTKYTTEAINEVKHFNSCKEMIFVDSKGVWIIPITIDMIEVVIENNINFLSFLKWSIKHSIGQMVIVQYL